MTDDDKVRENRLRRAAARQGMVIRKSRRRDPRALDFGIYYAADAHTNLLHKGPTRDGFTLDELEAFLTGE